MENKEYTDMLFDFIIYNYSLKTNKTGNNISKIKQIIDKVLNESFEDIFIKMMLIKHKTDVAQCEEYTEFEKNTMVRLIEISKKYNIEKNKYPQASISIINPTIKDPYDLKKFENLMMKIEYNKFGDVTMINEEIIDHILQ